MGEGEGEEVLMGRWCQRGKLLSMALDHGCRWGRCNSVCRPDPVARNSGSQEFPLTKCHCNLGNMGRSTVECDHWLLKCPHSGKQ